jgi:hypothetical protein
MSKILLKFYDEFGHLLTHWVVGGIVCLLFAATPEEILAGIVRKFDLPESTLHLGSLGLDIRTLFSIVGLAFLAIEVVRNRGKRGRFSGDIGLDQDAEHEVFYPRPFASPPNLNVSQSSDEAPRFKIIDQRADGFKIEIKKSTFVRQRVKWVARGIFRKAGDPIVAAK